MKITVAKEDTVAYHFLSHEITHTSGRILKCLEQKLFREKAKLITNIKYLHMKYQDQSEKRVIWSQCDHRFLQNLNIYFP